MGVDSVHEYEAFAATDALLLATQILTLEIDIYEGSQSDLIVNDNLVSKLACIVENICVTQVDQRPEA